ncbi:MAG: GAF domain-containing protein, partial [Elainellaceae cyanobacterium]
MIRVVLFDDGSIDVESLKTKLMSHGITPMIQCAATEANLWDILDRDTQAADISIHDAPTLVLASNHLIGASHSSMLSQIRYCHPNSTVVVTFANPDVREAIAAVRQGATDYIHRDQVAKSLPHLIQTFGDRDAARPGNRQPYAVLESQLSRQAMIANLSRQALAGTAIKLLFEQTVEQLEQMFNIDYCGVFDMVSYQRGFVLRAAAGWPDEAIDKMTVDVNLNSVIGQAVLTDGPILIPDIRDDSRFGALPSFYPKVMTRVVSVLIAGSGRQPFGLINLASAESNYFTAEDASFLQAIANTLAMIIERKRSEQSIRTHANELAGMTAILAKTNSELAERNRELNEFAYIASHDLKAPLRAIANLSEWIEEDLQGRVEPSTFHYTTLLRKRVYRIENLLNGLLKYSRAGRLRIEAETVSITAILKDVTDLLDPPAALAIAIGGDMPVFKARR